MFTFLGIRNETLGSVHGLHTPRFTMDEAQLPLVCLMSIVTPKRVGLLVPPAMQGCYLFSSWSYKYLSAHHNTASTAAL